MSFSRIDFLSWNDERLGIAIRKPQDDSQLVTEQTSLYLFYLQLCAVHLETLHIFRA